MTVVVMQQAFSGDADNLLKRWCDGLVGLQIRNLTRPELKGAVQCPSCGLLHGRICDAAYPFIHLYASTGERGYLDAARGVIDWCEANMLLPDGLYRNDRQTYWRSTTAFFAISLWKVLNIYGDVLPSATRERWRAIFLRAVKGIYRLYEEKTDGFSPIVNYRCIYPELMYLAWKETGESRYLSAAKRQADLIRTTAFNEEGFLVGEGKVGGRLDGETRRGCNMIDFGYNLEESLAALIEYANLADDGELRAMAVRSARVQLEFVLPDGAIDNSCGSRSIKWTYYGSRTSDGILSLLVLLKDDVPYAAEMARRVVRLYARCTGKDGLLSGGLMYADAGEPACVHHSFAHAKTLVDYIRSNVDAMPAAPLPRESVCGPKYFRSLDTYLVAYGPWRSTVSANDGFNICRAAAVSGGTLSMLWHEALGPVSIATAGEYFYAEPFNMQDDRHDMTMQCLAPRIVLGKLSNIFDYEVCAKGNSAKGHFTYEARGRLTDKNGGKGPDYRIRYEIDSYGVGIAAECADANARFVWPVVAAKDDRMMAEDHVVKIIRRGRTIRLESTVPIAVDRCDRGDRIWSPIAGILCVPFSVSLKEPVKLHLVSE